MNIQSNKNLTTVLKILSYIIAIIIIINCNTIYITSNDFPFFNKTVFYILIITVALYIICNIKKYNLKLDRTFLIGIGITGYLSVYVILSAIFSSNLNGIRNILYFLIFFSLVWVEKDKSPLPDILVAYINLMFFVALISIFFWTFGSFLHFLTPTGNTTIKWGMPNRTVSSYYNIYFETQYSNLGVRNSAIFVEAPIAALNLLTALSLNILFLKKNKFSRIKILVFIIAGLMTMSTAMYIGILILMVGKLFEKKENNKKQVLKYFFGILIVPIVGWLIYSLFNFKLDTTSGLDRKSDYLNAFSVWFNHPFIGAGINAGVHEGINLINGETIPHYGFSSSFTKFLGDNGLFILVLIVLAIIVSIAKGIRQNNYNRVIFTIILVYLFMVIIFAQSYLMFYLFIFIAIWTPKNIKEL